MNGKLTWIAACALALALIATGCGGDDGDDETEATGTNGATASLSKEEFVEQGNEICRQGNEEIEQAGQAVTQGDVAEFNSFVLGTLAPGIQRQIDDIRALGIPEGDEELVNGILDDAEAELDRLEANPSLVQRQDSELFADVNQRLDDYGLTECAGDED